MIKHIPPSSFVDPSAYILCEKFVLGENCYIGPGCVITCREFVAGDYLYFSANVEVGRGGCQGPNSKVYIGNNVGVFENTVINPSDTVTIGDNVGIGCECLLWTHGAWLDVLQGFPADFGPIYIGKNVWLPARSIMLPNTSIGDNTVIGIGSIITKNIPAGSLAAGVPCKVIRENCYPQILTYTEKYDIIAKIVKEWRSSVAPLKGIGDNEVTYHIDSDLSICLSQNRQLGCWGIGDDYQWTTISTEERKISGFVNDVVEDLRDFLRRKGIKIYTGKPFKSMPNKALVNDPHSPTPV